MIMGLLLLLISFACVVAVSIGLVYVVVDYKEDPRGCLTMLGIYVFCIICVICAVIKYIPVFHM